MTGILTDIRYGLRILTRSPVFTIISLVTLALGIGANTAMFSLVDAILLKPLPYKDPDRLTMLWEKPPGSERNSVSIANYLDWRDQNQVFEQMCAVTGGSVNLSGADEPEELPGRRVSANYFGLLGIKAFIGRTFLPDEDQPGNDKVAVISHRLWQRRFGADRNLVGNNVTLDGEKYTIIGVLAPDSSFDRTFAEIWIPFAIDPTRITREVHFLNVMARLKPGVSMAQARANMDSIARSIAEQFPKTNAGWGVTIDPLRDRLLGSQTRRTALIFFGAVGFVLLIACANVANLTLARGLSRQKEVAVRAALGASSSRLVRQFLTENIFTALIGGGFGVLLSIWFEKLLIAALPPFTLPDEANVAIDSRALMFALGVSVLTGFIFGLAPALQAARPNLNETLKEGGRGGTASRARHRLRGLLVVCEVALALVLLVGAGLLVRSFWRVLNVDPGFEPSNVLSMRVSLPRKRYPKAGSVAAFYLDAVRRIETLPGVEGAALAQSLPLLGWNFGMPFNIEGRPAVADSERPSAHYQMVSPDYFSTMGITVARGRAFAESDTSMSTRVAIINQVMAQRYFPDEDPLGNHLIIDGLVPGVPGLAPAVSWEIVGVISNVRESGLDEEQSPEVYVPFAQSPWGSTYLVVKTSGDPLFMAAGVQNEIRTIDKDQPVTELKSMDQIVAESVAGRRFGTSLLGIFAAVALLLSAIGIYGVISYSVTQRTHEIGIRMALGAQRRHVVRLIVGHGMFLSAIGVGAGLVGAFALTRLMSTLLFEVSATDPITFALIALLLAGVAFFASYLPARRATRIDPVIALRYE
jgi:putative ABC transport system permease protein